MKKSLVVCVLISILFLSGCETFKGMARDIENTGKNIQEGVNRVEDGNSK